MKNLGFTTTASPTLASSQRRSWLKSGQHKGTVSESLCLRRDLEVLLKGFLRVGFLPPSNLAINLDKQLLNWFNLI
jgi:hypothetical protein